VTTKVIDTVLRCLRNGAKPSGEDVSAATRELEAIREAAKTATDCGTVLDVYRHSEDIWKAWGLLKQAGRERS